MMANKGLKPVPQASVSSKKRQGVEMERDCQFLPAPIPGDSTSVYEIMGLFQAEATGGVQVSAHSEFKDSYLTLLVP